MPRDTAAVLNPSMTAAAAAAASTCSSSSADTVARTSRGGGGGSSSNPRFEELRRRIAPDTITDEAATRFLGARKGDVGKAAQMYIEYMEWRRAENIDAVLSEPPLADGKEAALRQRFNPRVLDGFDRSGRPIMFASFGQLDVSALAKEGVTTKDLTRRHARSLEQVLQIIIARSEKGAAGADEAPSARAPSPGVFLIIDVHGCTVTNALRAWKLWMAMAKVSQDYYPESLGQLCIVRAPRSGQWLIDKFKAAALDPVTAAKMEMHSGDPIPPLRRHLAEEVALPEVLLEYSERLRQRRLASGK